MRINYKSEKGAAIVLVAVLVTGIVMLVSVIAIENLRKSTELSGIQKRSLDNLYKAEEGAEYGLYVNKEKKLDNANTNTNGHFNISIWEKDTNVTDKGDKALEKLKQPTEGRDIVITSQSKDNANTNQNKASQKTIFTNLPNKYQDQVPLWNIREGCENNNDNCETSFENNTNGQYQVIVPTPIFERTGWSQNLEYRLVFKCGITNFWNSNNNSSGGFSNGCTISNVKLKIVGCDVSTCDPANGIPGCTINKDIDFRSGKSMSGYILPTKWFQIEENGNLVNLTDTKIVVEFSVDDGYVEKIYYPGSQNTVRMCQNTGGSWSSSNNFTYGISSFEIRKKADYRHDN